MTFLQGLFYKEKDQKKNRLPMNYIDKRFKKRFYMFVLNPAKQIYKTRYEEIHI